MSGLRVEVSLPDDVVERIAMRAAEIVLERQAAAAGEARRWLTLEEAGDRLGCSSNAVRMRVKRGRLESRRQGRRVYVSAASVNALGGEA
jgi:excisionase family DNA binding protein